LERVLGAFFLGQSLAFLFQPGRIVSFPGNAVAAVEFQDPLGDVVEKITVVRHRDHGARILFEKMFEPGHRLGIQVVGGLVQEQHVGLRQQQTAQGDAALLAARQFPYDGIPRRQPQRVGGDFELALQFPAAYGVDLVLHLRLLFHELVHLVVRHGFGETIADRIEPVDEALHVADAFDDHLAHGLGVVEQRLLRQVTDLDIGLRPGFALDLLVEAGHNLEQRRFTGAVQAQHADLGAGEETQGNVAQNHALGWHNLANPVHGVNELSHVLPITWMRGGTPRLSQRLAAKSNS
jgi:hypothetical protein